MNSRRALTIARRTLAAVFLTGMALGFGLFAALYHLALMVLVRD